MKANNNSEFGKYSAEAREKWGNTEAYSQYEKKAANYTEDKQKTLINEMNGIFAEFSDCMKKGDSHNSAVVQCLVEKLQKHITDNYYNCTKQILSGLGQMYVCDERFKTNIDSHGTGTAEFVCSAIEVYCED